MALRIIKYTRLHQASSAAWRQLCADTPGASSCLWIYRDQHRSLYSQVCTSYPTYFKSCVITQTKGNFWIHSTSLSRQEATEREAAKESQETVKTTNVDEYESRRKQYPTSPLTRDAKIDEEDLREPTDEERKAAKLAASIMEERLNKVSRYVFSKTIPMKSVPELAKYEMEDLASKIEENCRRIIARHAGRLTDDRSRSHVHLSSLVLATYQVLMPLMKNKEQVIDLIRRGFGAILRSKEVEEIQNEFNRQQQGLPYTQRGNTLAAMMTKIMMSIVPDKMRAAIRMTENMVKDFGKSFEIHSTFSYPEGSSNTGKLSPKSIQLDVHRCLYFDIFQSENLPELTLLFCALDRAIYKPIHSSKTSTLSFQWIPHGQVREDYYRNSGVQVPDSVSDNTCTFIIENTNAK